MPRRNAKNYDGTQLTSHHLRDVLPNILSHIQGHHKERPDLILASWAQVIGPKLSKMTEASSFIDGVLTVKVKNSTLYSLLNTYEKPRLLAMLRKNFPDVSIQNLRFRIG